MKTRKWSAVGTFALGLLLGGGFAFGGGYIYPPDLVDKIQIGVTTSKQVTEILGPPAGISHFPRRGVETWDYTTLEAFNKKKSGISIEIDGSGIVRNVIKVPTYGP
jgi:outer membrane protein assembly factor BamE (lipoprotein component of BamABCDE complex)